MRHEFLVLTVKKILKSVSIYGSCRKNKTGVPFFGPPCIYDLCYIYKSVAQKIWLYIYSLCTYTNLHFTVFNDSVGHY